MGKRMRECLWCSQSNEVKAELQHVEDNGKMHFVCKICGRISEDKEYTFKHNGVKVYDYGE